jgi:hypothetical protein
MWVRDMNGQFIEEITVSKKQMKKLGVVAHICKLSTWEVVEEDCEFEASLGYIEKHCLQTNKRRPTNKQQKMKRSLTLQK